MKRFKSFKKYKKKMRDRDWEYTDFYEEYQPPKIRPVAKEPYLLPQPEGLMRVQDVLFAESDLGRCVLLRWVMESDFSVDAMTLEVDQLDAADECIATTPVTYRGRDLSNLRKGDLFIPDFGIPVESRCAAVRVRVLEVVSGRYIYRVKGTRVEAGYRAPEYWSYDKKPGRGDDLSEKIPLRVTSKGRGRARFILPVAILSAFLMLLLVLYPYVRPFLPESEEETAAEAETIVFVPTDGTAMGGDFGEFMTMGEDGVVEYTTMP